MTNPVVIPIGQDGLPLDDVTHYPATDAHLHLYDQAAEAMSRFRAPSLLDAGDPHSYLLVGLMDGTGNDADADPLHATNIARFRDQLKDLSPTEFGSRIRFEYLPGPGTQDGFLASMADNITGRTSLSRAERMYTKLIELAQEIHDQDPQARIGVHAEGFSRGASQTPLLTRIIDERGFPDLNNPVYTVDADGTRVKTFPNFLQEPGKTPMSVGLYDPVPTGYMELYDRRLAPSVVSGLQLTAANERRGLFPSDQIIRPGLSEDGRFLNVTVPGAHSDVGGSYLRDGLPLRAFNLMNDYHNRLIGEPVLERVHEPTDPRMNVIHRSELGMNGFYRLTPRADRATPDGQIENLTPDYTRHTRPGDVVPAPAQLPEALRVELQRFVDEAKPVERTTRVSDPALTEGDTLAARLEQRGNVVFRPYEQPMFDRPGVRMAAGLGALGAGASIFDAKQTGERIGDQLSQSNPLAAQSELEHYAARGVGGWLGGAAAGAAVGWGSGPGVIGFVAVGAVSTSAAGDKIADWWDDRKIYHQTDREGVAWEFNGRAWTRPMQLDTTKDGIDNPTEVDVTASLGKARELNYRASNVAASLALGNLPRPRDPYDLPANETDAPSIELANWKRNPETGGWQREITTTFVERGLSPKETIEATPERAAQLDDQAGKVIQANIANSPAALAVRYEMAFQRAGFDEFGRMPEAIQAALTNTNQLIAHDGSRYQLGEDGQWRDGDKVALANIGQELSTTRQVLQPALQEMGERIAAIPSRETHSAEERQLESLVYQYRVAGQEISPDWQQAVIRATQQTKGEYGLDQAGAMQLQRKPDGTVGVDSPIAHMRFDANGKGEVVAITSSEQIREALAAVQEQTREQAQPDGITTLAAGKAVVPSRSKGGVDSEPETVERAPERTAMLADNPSHPDFQTFNRIHEWVKGTGQWDEDRSKNVASALFKEQTSDPMIKRVDKVGGGLGRDGAENVFAVYSPNGDKGPHLWTEVDGRQVAEQPATQNLEQAEQIKQQQVQQQELEQQQQRDQQQVAKGPSMSM